MSTWKRLFLSLGFLFLIAIIGWTTWYFTIVHPKLTGEPFKVYSTKSQITENDRSDVASVETSQEQNISQEEGTAETHTHPFDSCRITIVP